MRILDYAPSQLTLFVTQTSVFVNKSVISNKFYFDNSSNIQFTMWYKYICIQILILHSTYSQNYDPNRLDVYLTDNNVTNSFINETTLTPFSKLSVAVHLNDSDERVTMFVIQVHSFQIETTISSALNVDCVNGTNIGLVQILNGTNNYMFYIENNNDLNNTILIVVIPYEQAPIPGGCNMEFQTEIAPYQQINYTNELIQVDAQAASVVGHVCEASIIRHDLYHFYLPKGDFSMRSYFDAIKVMLTVDNVENHGTKVATVKSWLRKLYNNYKGAGVVYTIVASYKHLKSAYIPIVSYGCDVERGCFDTSYTTILQYIVGALGLFVCVYGRHFLQAEILLFGTLVSGSISYVLLIHLLDELALWASLIFGCVFAVLLLMFCKMFRSNVVKEFVSNLFTIFALGCLLASIVFYSGLSDLTIAHNELTYWGFFSSIVLLTMIVLTNYIYFGNILASAIVGSFAFVSFLCRFTTPSLEYIFLNTIRRATVLGSEIAVIDAPYQWFDLKLTLVWLFLVILGVSRQWYLHKRHASFPTVRTSSPSHFLRNDEHTPLLQPTSDPYPTNRVIMIHSTPTNT